MDVFGFRLVGLTIPSGRRVALSLALVLGVVVVRSALGWLLGRGTRGAAAGHGAERLRFWTRQGVSLALTALLVVGLASIWLESAGSLATVAGITTAGVAVALQRVITAFAAYLIILRGRVFTVGDRITMAGVRGDVVALGFMQTSVMEMGEPPGVQPEPPGQWVHARQYTGRIVRVTNDKIFDSPVYNYTREFPYLWEEIRLPVKYDADRRRAEAILLDATRRHTADVVRTAEGALAELRRHYFLPEEAGLEPAVYYRLTDNWLELSVRFVVPERGVRAVKDAISRDILTALEGAGIGIASATYEIVGLPPLRVVREDEGGRPAQPAGDRAAPA